MNSCDTCFVIFILDLNFRQHEAPSHTLHTIPITLDGNVAKSPFSDPVESGYNPVLIADTSWSS